MATTTPSSDGAGAGIVRVLIADDDARVRYALRTLIEADPCLVVAAACGAAEALDHVQRVRPAVVLLDLARSPSHDGLRLLQQLIHLSDRPVVAMSVRGGLGVAALAAGACAFVEKGAAPDAVLAALHAAADGRIPS